MCGPTKPTTRQKKKLGVQSEELKSAEQDTGQEDEQLHTDMQVMGPEVDGQQSNDPQDAGIPLQLPPDYYARRRQLSLPDNNIDRFAGRMAGLGADERPCTESELSWRYAALFVEATESRTVSLVGSRACALTFAFHRSQHLRTAGICEKCRRIVRVDWEPNKG
ncbi:uncharacterized protein MYCGRDRAFT_98003 [Zymoseptoria tritici IPO323]|uniref:Uncharacterized protein n=1 Tax=Zymoseptoria tritici (strain CBS 115943 / IPO323) TaxID=336722 RepID=F9XS13_ZYMTI|nr:uncharacterized protein MYCGRDRAFT_98003 [Zymoseptoria tritici IPO323]EGP81960.1 hypothetical protein MYCGRDRAFT_98003 [Zymoseptoria tritici IPO323]